MKNPEKPTLNLEQEKFIGAGWKQTDYASLFVEGSEVSSDDFFGVLPPNTEIEGQMITVARHKTHSDTFIDIIYIKSGDVIPPLESWSSREVYRVQDGIWKLVKKEAA